MSAPADKAANNVIIIWKRYYVDVLKGELNSTSTYVPAQRKKDKLLLYHIDTLTKIKVKATQKLLNHASYQILSTAFLSFFQSILHPL